MRLTTKAIVTALLATLPPISLFGAGVKLVKGENAKDTNIYYLPDDYKKKLDGGAYEDMKVATYYVLIIQEVFYLA